MDVLREIAQITAGFSGEIGVWARSLDGGEPVAVNADSPFPTASTIKVPIMYEVFRQAQAGRFRLDDPLPLTRANKVPGSGVLKHLTDGQQLSIRDYCVLMTIISDNTATNVLLDLVGIDAVNQALADLGLAGTRLYRKIFLGSGRLAESTPADLGRLMELIAHEQVLTPAACREILQIMRQQQYKDLLTRYIEDYEFEDEEFGRSPVTVASKSGWDDGTRNDVGVIWAPQARYVVAIMSRGCRDLREHPDNEGSIAVARVARAIYRHFTGR